MQEAATTDEVLQISVQQRLEARQLTLNQSKITIEEARRQLRRSSLALNHAQTSSFPLPSPSAGSNDAGMAVWDHVPEAPVLARCTCTPALQKLKRLLATML